MNDRMPDPTVIGCIKLAALLIKSLFELCKMAATIFLRPFLMVCLCAFNLSAVLAQFSGPSSLVLPLLPHASVQ